MPFCPQCGDEYRPGFTVCADCGVPLVKALEPESGRGVEDAGGSHGGWDQVAETGQVYEAELIALRLRESGIETQVVDQSFRQEPMPGVRSFAVVRVLVPTSRAEDARRVLGEGHPLPEDGEVAVDGSASEPAGEKPGVKGRLE